MADNLHNTAESRYNSLSEQREHFLNRGRQCSELTIPTLIPENSHTPSQDFYSPFQSVGSRGVNNLASKLLLLLLPPNQPFFRLAIQGKAKEQVQEQPELKTLIEKSLAKIERDVMGKIESLAIRVPIFEAIKHLIVGGNVLCHMPKEGSMRVFPLNQYVCKREMKPQDEDPITKYFGANNVFKTSSSSKRSHFCFHLAYFKCAEQPDGVRRRSKNTKKTIQEVSIDLLL